MSVGLEAKSFLLPKRSSKNKLCPHTDPNFFEKVFPLLSRGLHVLCETPLARCPLQATLPECRRHTWFAFEIVQGFAKSCRDLPGGSKRIPRLSNGGRRPSKDFQRVAGPSKRLPSLPKGAQDLPGASKDSTGRPRLYEGFHRRSRTFKRHPTTVRHLKSSHHPTTCQACSRGFQWRPWASGDIPKASKRLPRASGDIPRVSKRLPKAFRGHSKTAEGFPTPPGPLQRLPAPRVARHHAPRFPLGCGHCAQV